MFKNNKGMTLVEIVVAVILLMIIITGFSTIITQTVLWAGKSNHDSASITIGRKYTDNNIAGDVSPPLESNVTKDSETAEVNITYQSNDPSNLTTETVSRWHTRITVDKDGERPIKYDIFTNWTPPAT